MASLGQDLKRERETRGITLREIADSTRIGLRYLEALERDQLELIPRQFFLRAILRSYARAVGLDENQVVKRYDDLVQFGEQLEYRESGLEAAPARAGVSGRTKALLLALLLIAVAGGLLYIFVLAPRRAVRPGPQAPPPGAAVEVIPTPAPSAPAPLEVPLAGQVKGLRLEASFSEETWLRVYADGQRIWDGIKRVGETLEVDADRELVLSSGNAGGMKFTLNGQRARPLGPHGAVMTDIRMTPDNYTSFLLPREGD